MFGNDWDEILQDEIQKPYFQELRHTLAQEYKVETVYPPQDELFSALKLTPYSRTRVVILGQDPYHGAGQAHGLSFSVKPGVRIPPSLRNIYTELHNDMGVPVPNHGSLLHWAEAGVLMLNAVLTVREGEPNSHKGLGWETFTDAIMKKLNERKEPMVFILWGSYAQQKGTHIDPGRHLVIKSPHPSPFSAHRGFLGSHPFSQANQYLESKGLQGIDWSIPNI
ncbi:uracil-DNA glycosylase [Paenibacillus sp. sgz5001063]|uniref:uracil-DNA glycosylase n=1 Tax=Paenibacillus sp. sgz5001063 TaxID=3242474 RepID=UPI0036D31CF7